MRRRSPTFGPAIRSLTRRNPNPYDGEPYYNLGLALKIQGQYGEAFDAFYKATWNAAWQDAAYFELARLAARGGRWEEALELAVRSLERNWRHHQARQLKIALLRRLGRMEAAAGRDHYGARPGPHGVWGAVGEPPARRRPPA